MLRVAIPRASIGLGLFLIAHVALSCLYGIGELQGWWL